MNHNIISRLVDGLHPSKAPQGAQKHIFTAHKWHILLALFAGLAIGAGVVFALLQFTPPIEPEPQEDISTLDSDEPQLHNGDYEWST